jgi:hypothetical protein
MKSFRKSTSAFSVVTLALLIVCANHRVLGHINGHESNVAGVLLGPCGSPAAQGPNGSDDDYSNASIDGGIAVTPGGLTTGGSTVVFKNTLENAGISDDAFIITMPAIAPGFAVEVSNDFGEHYVKLDSWNSSVTLPVAYRASVTFFVRITVPAGLRALTGFDTVVRASSTIDPAVTNDTIDRVYTGFVRIDSSARIVSATGAAEIVNAMPGSEIEFAITYTNISSATGSGNSLLTARNLVITENGNVAPNNWSVTTEHIVGASDTQGGYIVGDREGSTSLTDIVTNLDAGQSGIFKFRRRVK